MNDNYPAKEYLAKQRKKKIVIGTAMIIFILIFCVSCVYLFYCLTNMIIEYLANNPVDLHSARKVLDWNKVSVFFSQMMSSFKKTSVLFPFFVGSCFSALFSFIGFAFSMGKLIAVRTKIYSLYNHPEDIKEYTPKNEDVNLIGASIKK